MSILDNLTWDNLVAAWDDAIDGDAPPPPTEDAVAAHNADARAYGLPEIEYDEATAQESAAEYERQQRSALERLADAADETRQFGRDAVDAARWTSIAITVSVVALSVFAVTAFLWFWGPPIGMWLADTFGGVFDG